LAQLIVNQYFTICRKNY